MESAFHVTSNMKTSKQLIHQYLIVLLWTKLLFVFMKKASTQMSTRIFVGEFNENIDHELENFTFHKLSASSCQVTIYNDEPGNLCEELHEEVE